MTYRIAFWMPKKINKQNPSYVYAHLTESSAANIREEAEPHYLAVAIGPARVSDGDGLEILRLVDEHGDHCLRLDIEDLLAQSFLMGVDFARKKPVLAAKLQPSISRAKKKAKS